MKKVIHSVMQNKPLMQQFPGSLELSRKSRSAWQTKGIAAMRILFGLIWLFDAYLKWQPAFIQGFGQMVDGAVQGQPDLIKNWVGIWANLININPQLWAYACAVIETLLAISLLLGLFSNLMYVVGIFYTLGIWSVAEVFGGPYVFGQSTDIGTALPYAVLFGVLLCVAAGRSFSLDQYLTSRLGR